MSNPTCRLWVLAALAAAALGGTGCYKATYTTGLPPGGGLHQRTVHHFLFGMAGGGNVDAGPICPAGVAWVHEEKSFLDLLIAGFTGYLYTPTSVEIECAAPRGAVFVPPGAVMY